MDDGQRYLYYRGIALKMVRAYLARYNLDQDARVLAHDIASDIVVREMSGEWAVKINVSRVIGFKIMEAVHGPYKKRRDKMNIRLSAEHDLIPAPEVSGPEFPGDPLDDILGAEAGKTVVLCLWRRRRERLADVVRRVAEIAGEKWTRENISAIVKVKRILSGKK